MYSFYLLLHGSTFPGTASSLHLVLPVLLYIRTIHSSISLTPSFPSRVNKFSLIIYHMLLIARLHIVQRHIVHVYHSFQFVSESSLVVVAPPTLLKFPLILLMQTFPSILPLKTVI